MKVVMERERERESKNGEIPSKASDELAKGNHWTLFCYEKEHFNPQKFEDEYRFDKNGDPYLYQKGFTSGDKITLNYFKIRCNICGWESEEKSGGSNSQQQAQHELPEITNEHLKNSSICEAIIAEDEKNKKTKSDKELCQECQQFLSKDFEPWEKNKLKAKQEAVRCEHDHHTYYYDKKGKVIVKVGNLRNITFCSPNDPVCNSGEMDGWGDTEKIPCKYHGENNNNSPFVKGTCKQCQKNNLWINEDKDCFACDLVQKKLEMGVMIKSAGIERVRLTWHNSKSERDEGIKQNPHVANELKHFFSEIDKVLGLQSDYSTDNDNPTNPNLIIINQIEQVFIQNNIKKVERQGRQLIITFNNETDTNNLTQEQQQELNNFLIANNLSELDKSKLRELKNAYINQRQPINYIPWIIGGAGIAVVLGIILALIVSNKKNKKY